MSPKYETLLRKVKLGQVMADGWEGFIHYTEDGKPDYVVFEDKAITDPDFIKEYIRWKSSL